MTAVQVRQVQPLIAVGVVGFRLNIELSLICDCFGLLLASSRAAPWSLRG